MELSGKKALVTGGARRVGRVITLALADAGVDVVIHHSGIVPIPEQLYQELDQRKVKSWFLPADFRNQQEIPELITRAIAAAGSLDILVNNAAIFPENTLEDLQWDGLLEPLQVNAWAPFVLAREFARRMESGRIINIIDTRIQTRDWSHFGYILAKHLLAELTRMLAVKLAPAFTVNAVAPGLILPKDERKLYTLAPTLPLKRHGGVEDVTGAILYLLRADFVTGQTIYVDGGERLA